MHENSRRLMAQMLTQYAPGSGGGKLLYDVGSYDVNGNYRSLCTNRGWKYIGLDIVAGPNVDIVLSRDPADAWLGLTVEKQADLVISGSTMEHVRMPWIWIERVQDIMKPGARFLLHTHASWPLHRHPRDCWRLLPDGAIALAEWAHMKLLKSGLSDVEMNGKYHGTDIWAVFEKPLD